MTDRGLGIDSSSERLASKDVVYEGAKLNPV
jgi:hypothetical protein